MEVLENPKFFVSLLIGGIVMAGISSAYQIYNEENEGKVKPKAVIRDGLLGAIFVGLAWTFLPDSMKSLTEGFSSTTAAVTNAVENTAKAISSEIDVQIGPASF
jgi:preprotein translocase subunit Sec61beta